MFSLGAILYEMATGTPPFGDPNDTQYPQRVRTMRQTPLLRLKGDFPNSFATLIEQCLQKSPSERPPSADLLASQFAGLIGGATVPLLHDELVRLGLVSGDTGRGERTAEPIRPNTSRGRVRLIALSCGLLALGVATGLLWDRALRVGSRGPTNSGANAPPVAAEQALMLRVVATPWAHVLVDGVQHETTPFARPIALAPGKHVVRLEHPNAAPEERLIEGKAGEIILLNVNLHLERPPLSPPELSAPEEESTP